MNYTEFRNLIEAEQRADREAMKSFVEGAQSANFELFCASLEQIESRGLFKSAFRAVTRVSVPDEFRDRLAGAWCQSGNHIRSEVGDDLILIKALRVLLPTYRGDALRLYRGDSAWNRRRRTYGLSWTTDIEVARSFAKG
jgi:hypothetical protein